MCFSCTVFGNRIAKTSEFFNGNRFRFTGLWSYEQRHDVTHCGTKKDFFSKSHNDSTA